MSLKDPENFAAGDTLDLGDTVRITKNDTNLRRRQPFLRKLTHAIFHICSGDLKPTRRSPLVRQRRRGDTLSTTVHATHGDGGQ